MASNWGLSSQPWMLIFGLPFILSPLTKQESDLAGSRSTLADLPWTNWSHCFGRCSVKFQMRKCLEDCDDSKLEIRECAARHTCTAYKTRIRPIYPFDAKVGIEVNISVGWKQFCHSTWEINLAHEVCHAYGFPSALAAFEGDSLVQNDTCLVNLGSENTKCGDFESEILSSCNNTARAVAVCKVPVSLNGSYSGRVKISHNGTWKTISTQGWDMNDAKVICRQLGFKDAIAPFSTNISLLSASKTCIRQVKCSGNESSLGFCPLQISSCKPLYAETAASVTCDPKTGLDLQFRKVMLKELGEKMNFSCNLGSSTSWYDVTNTIIINNTQHKISISASQATLTISSITPDNAGVYLCLGPNNTRIYGILVIYVRAPSTGKPQNILNGSRNQLNCDTSGVPRPIVLPNWWKDGRRLPTGGIEYNTTQNNNLIIVRNATSEDKGMYSCETSQVYENGAIQQNLTFNVTAVYPGSCISQGKCKNGATCREEGGGYNCNCATGFQGDFCEKSTQATGTTMQPPTAQEPRKIYIFTPNVTYVVGDKVDLHCKILRTKRVFVTAQWIRYRTQKLLETRNYTAEDGSEKTYHSFHYLIDKVSLDDSGMYTCVATLWNSTSSTTLEAFYNLEVRDLKAHEKSKSTAALAVPLGITSTLLCLSIVIGLVYHKRRVTDQRNGAPRGMAENVALERGGDDLDTRYLAVTPSCWEIASKQIDLQNVLGCGSFGEVWKAVVSGLKGIRGETTVAVKKLKHNSSDTEKESLAQEIELGKSLDGDRHPNIVNFLGCVSTSAPMMLILEYAPYGDLLGYLRQSRGMEDKYYSSPESCQQEVTSYDLLSFAQQIASGMSFLASKKILHRDLAARNVLVGEGRICKITDFGLALIRDKYQYLYCTSIRKGRLPIKWTAPEHLFNNSEDGDARVSEKSDVWSYGVVLYEIFTLGGAPYPGWNEWKVVYELKVNKYRMSQPEHVSDELYQIMMECWNEDPNTRPTFDRLHEMTTEFLQEEHYIDLDLSKYEPSLYTNVEEMAASMNQATSLEPGNAQSEDHPTRESSDAPKKDSWL